MPEQQFSSLVFLTCALVALVRIAAFLLFMAAVVLTSEMLKAFSVLTTEIYRLPEVCGK